MVKWYSCRSKPKITGKKSGIFGGSRALPEPENGTIFEKCNFFKILRLS